MEKPQSLTSSAQRIHSDRKQTVLVIDDNEDFLNLTKIMLQMDDFEVLSALGGKKAFSLLKEGHKPDLILLDFRMEEMSGTEFLAELEKNIPEIFESVPIVFLSGMDALPETKASGFIRKPIDMDNFLTAAHRFIEIGANRIRCN
jgi:CheY-like chemotaxis protein